MARKLTASAVTLVVLSKHQVVARNIRAVSASRTQARAVLTFLRPFGISSMFSTPTACTDRVNRTLHTLIRSLDSLFPNRKPPDPRFPFPP